MVTAVQRRIYVYAFIGTRDKYIAMVIMSVFYYLTHFGMSLVQFSRHVSHRSEIIGYLSVLLGRHLYNTELV